MAESQHSACATDERASVSSKRRSILTGILAVAAATPAAFLPALADQIVGEQEVRPWSILADLIPSLPAAMAEHFRQRLSQERNIHG